MSGRSRSLVIGLAIGALAVSQCSERSDSIDNLDNADVTATVSVGDDVSTTVLAGDEEPGSSEILIMTVGPRRGPDAPPTGVEVMRLKVSGFTFILHSQGDRCMQVEIEGNGLQTTVDSFCATDWQPIDATRDCGILEGSDAEFSCDVDLPQVIYGHILDPAVAHVCIGKMSEDTDLDGGVIGVRRLDVGPQGFTMSVRQPFEDWAAHMLDARGIPIGDPPLDAPSFPIYKRCQSVMQD